MGGGQFGPVNPDIDMTVFFSIRIGCGVLCENFKKIIREKWFFFASIKKNDKKPSLMCFDS